ncbi:hypothetical protein HK100_007030 [Physocladia obscura]|uniref:EF-hand domain-containing protein n=1 Tax=Physocladia obscura TaxID=109957 RepID=A0AAD5XFZ3_9FUNG|nr:hypothetical protein HK100_007030 [Physocladia obscura]
MTTTKPPAPGSNTAPVPNDPSLAPFTFGTHPADATEISVATLVGACSGFAVKKIAKGTGLVIGVGFLSLQALSYSGFVKIDWPKIESAIVKRLDADGDGQLTQKDFKLMGLRLIHNLTSDIPSAGGFSAAFFVGFRYG